MNRSIPPRLSTWLLRRLATNHRRESMMGDLIEQYAEGRSAMWYRRQVLITIAVAVWADLREHKLQAAGAIVLWFVCAYALWAFTAAVRQALFPNFLNREWQSEMLRQLWVYYGVPFVFIMCIGQIAIGWLIARVTQRSGMAMVVVCMAAQVVTAAPWAFRTWGLLQARLWGGLYDPIHLWPFWDYRLALIFQALCLFALYPVCLLLGGSWAAGQTDRTIEEAN